jgi:Zn-dependent peptidase ImmA (M78 family)
VARRPNRAEQAALELLERFGVKEAPVPVEEIATALGADVQIEPLEGGLSGVLYREGGRTVLGVNGWHAEVRQRFTIAHELGHLQLHQDALFVDGLLHRDSTSSRAVNTHEIEANAFAAELLMPRHILFEELRQRLPESGATDPNKLTRHLAEKFEVSEQAMEFRLANLGLTTSF